MIDGLNDVNKRYIYQLMSKVQLPGSVRFDSQIKIHTGTENKEVSLAKEFKDHLEREHRQNGAIDQGKSRKRFTERKWTERKYHVQYNASVELKYVKNYCNTNQFPTLTFCVTIHFHIFEFHRSIILIMISKHGYRAETHLYSSKIKKMIHGNKMYKKKVSCSG